LAFLESFAVEVFIELLLEWKGASIVHQ